MERNITINKVCDVCGCGFATRQGLSSHARLHLRNLGVPLSECTNGPIELLYKIARENKDPDLDFSLDPKKPMVLPVPEAKRPPKSKSEKVPTPKSSSGVSLSGSKRAASPPLASPHKTSEPRKSDAPSSSSKQTTLKPQWAPQETDAPLTLVSNSSDEVHVCLVCGAWYETRKGLSSHARAHLRQLGVSDASSKISPIALLYQLKNIDPEDQGPVAPLSSPESFAAPHALDSPSTSSLGPPPGKRAKAPKKFVCVLCGEEFENRKGLGSHARSHLRQIGVSDLLGKASAVDAIEELASSGVLADIWPMTADKARAQNPPAQPNHPQPGPAKAKAQPSAPSPAPHPAQTSPHRPPGKAPKAKKGFRLAVDPQWKKPAQEPLDGYMEPPFDGQPIPLILCEYCGQLFDSRKGLSCHVRAHLRQLGIAWTSKSSPIDLLRQLMGKEASAEGGELPSAGKKGNSQNPSFCELCGFEFHHRKALASHARAHLRQLGVTEWKTDGSKGSPIELLNEWIQKEPAKVAEITRRYLMGDLYIKKRPTQSPAPPVEADPAAAGGPEPQGPPGRQGALLGAPGESPKAPREPSDAEPGRVQSKQSAFSDVRVPPATSRVRPPKPQVATGQENVVDGSPQQQLPRPGNIPALLPNPPLTPLVKLVGKVYSLKCRFCDQVFQGPLSVQEDWIAHLQKHILKLGYKGKASPSPAVAMSTQSMVDPAAV